MIIREEGMGTQLDMVGISEEGMGANLDMMVISEEDIGANLDTVVIEGAGTMGIEVNRITAKKIIVIVDIDKADVKS